MKRKRRTHSPEFKAGAAMTACRGDMTMVEKFDVHANQITDWKQQLPSGAPDVFSKGACKAGATEETIEQLHAKIGRLAIENDFLKRGLKRIHVPRGKKW